MEELRTLAASAPPAPDAMAAYLEKVHHRAYTVQDADIDALKAEGFTEDEIFEQTVAAALTEGLRRYDAARKAIG